MATWISSELPFLTYRCPPNVKLPNALRSIICARMNNDFLSLALLPELDQMFGFEIKE